MRRREFLMLVGGALAVWPLTARTGDSRVVGMLTVTGEDTFKAMLAALRAGLKDGGFIEGASLAIEARYAAGDPARLAPLAAELAALKPSVIIASTNVAIIAARHAAPAVPIVGLIEHDPIALGFAQSYARPGGMITGLTFTAGEDAEIGKRLELLRELVPGLRRVGFIFWADSPTAGLDERLAREGAARLDLGFVAFPVRTVDDLQSAFAPGTSDVDAILVLLGATPAVAGHLGTFVELALHAKMPVLSLGIPGVRAGLLAAYGPDLLDLTRRAGGYAAKILAGSKPGDLPIEQPLKFQFIINLKTAKALGLDVPLHLQQLADEVIE
jgi:putative ABC transport system substrate-binding protein